MFRVLAILVLVSAENYTLYFGFLSSKAAEGIKLYVDIYDTDPSTLKFYYFSGRSDPYNFLQDMQLSYIIEDDGSTHLTTTSLASESFPSSRAYYASAKNNNLIFIAGGIGENGILNDIWSFDQNINQWNQFVSANQNSFTPRYDVASVGYIGTTSNDQFNFSVFGGISDSETSATLEILYFNMEESKYNIELTNDNFNKICFSHGLAGSQIQFYNASLYVFSGVFIDSNGKSEYYNGICEFNIKNNLWKNITIQGLFPNSSHGSSVLNGTKIYYFLGKNDSALNDGVYVFDLSNMTAGWSRIATIDNDIYLRYSAGCAQLQNSNIFDASIYVYGGKSLSSYLNTFLAIDITPAGKIDFTYLDPEYTPGPRHSSQMCQLSDSIILFGGKNRDSCNNELWTLTFENGYDYNFVSVSAEGVYPKARYKHSITCQGNFLILSGGSDDQNEILTDYWILERSGLTEYIWTQIITSDFVYPPPTTESCLVFDFPYFYQIGGYEKNGPSNKVWKYDFTKNSFSEMKIADNFQPVAGHGCILRKENNSTYIDIFLGYNSNIGHPNNSITTLKINEKNVTTIRSNYLRNIIPVSFFYYAYNNDRLYIYGGINYDSIPNSNIYSVDLNTLNVELLLDYISSDGVIINQYSGSYIYFQNYFLTISGLTGYGYTPYSVSTSFIYLIEFTTCYKGFYLDKNKCTQCKPGTYKNETDSTCIECPEGTFSSFPAATNKIQCVPCYYGTFSKSKGSSKCQACPQGKICFVGSSYPITYQVGLSNTQPDLVEPKNENFFIMVLFLTFTGLVVLFITAWFLCLKFRIFFSIFDVFYIHHVEHAEEEVHSESGDKQKYSYVGGFFTGLAALVMMLIFTYYLYIFIHSNKEEHVELVPANTLTDKDGLHDEKIQIFIEFHSFRGENCDPKTIPSDDKKLTVTEKYIYHADSSCSLKYSLKKNSYFSSDDFVDFKFDCVDCYTSDIIVALEGSAAYHSKKSRCVQNLTLEDGNVFIGSDPSIFTFGVIPAFYQDFTSGSKNNHYGYRISKVISAIPGSTTKPSTIILNSQINFRVALSLDETGIYTTAVQKFDTIGFLAIAISSSGGIFALIIFIMKFYETVFYWIKYKKLRYESPYSLELQRLETIKNMSKHSQDTSVDERQAIN